MNVQSLLLCGAAAIALSASLAAPAQAAKLQQFWVINFSHHDITYVYALQDKGHGTRDLMGENGHLDYNPKKVPDEVLVLAPNRGKGCFSDVKIIAYDSDDEYGDYPYEAMFRHINLCVPGQTINVGDGDFN